MVDPAPARHSPRRLKLPLRARFSAALAAAGPWAVLLLFLAAAASLWLAWRVLQPTPDRHLVIATGPAQGAYEEFAKRYLPLLKAQGLSVELRSTEGSADNLALLRDPASGVHAAFVQGRPDDAEAPAAAVKSLGSVAVEPLWLFVREARVAALPGGRLPDNLAGLAGWRIDTGPEGGGSGPLFRLLARAHGLPAEDLRRGERAAVNGVVELVQGRVDALALVSSAEAPLVQYLLSTPGIRLFDFAQAEAIARRHPHLRALVLPRGMVDLAREQPPRDLHLVASTALLAVRSDLHPALAQLLLQAAQQAHGGPGWFNHRGEFPQPASDGLPLAAEADHFYRHGPPWLQRYLPFWLANFVDRMWIVVLPLLAALLPLSRVLPPLVTLRLRSRVYRWYANLRAIEQALERPGADIAALHLELDALDAQTEHIGLPLSFTNELYDLRSHIHLVRRRLQARAQPAAS